MKELKVRAVNQSGGLYEIFWEGGGEIPDYLSGLWRSVGLAQEKIKQYQAMVRGSADIKRPKPRKAAEKQEEVLSEAG